MYRFGSAGNENFVAAKRRAVKVASGLCLAVTSGGPRVKPISGEKSIFPHQLWPA